MKRMFRNGAVLFGLLVAFQANAHSNDVLQASTQAITKVETADKEPNIIIRDRDGRVVKKTKTTSQDLVSVNAYTEGLVDGNYTFEQTRGTEIVITPFSVSSEGVHVQAEEVYSLFLPMVRTKGDLLLISQLALEKGSLDVQVFYNPENDGNQRYELIYAEELGETNSIERVYALNKEEAGKYKVLLTYNGRTFEEQFTF